MIGILASVLLSIKFHVALNSEEFFMDGEIHMSDPADIDVFKTSSGRLKKVTTSYNQTRRRQDVWKKTSDFRRLEDVLFTLS